MRRGKRATAPTATRAPYVTIALAIVAAALLAQVTNGAAADGAAQDGAAAPVTTLGDERRINAFFRLGSPELMDRLRQRFPEMPTRPDPRQVFRKLRELRNAW
jgi:hypothetical protein